MPSDPLRRPITKFFSLLRRLEKRTCQGNFPLGGIFGAERHFLLFKDQLAESGRQKTKENIIPRGNFLLIETGLEDNQEGENSSFIFTVCVKSVRRHHFKLAYVVLQMAVEEFFENHFYKWRNRPF